MQDIPRRRRRLLLIGIIISAIVAGCSSDERVVEISRESMNRQAEQNREMAQQNQAVTQTTHELIKAESNVRSDASQLQQQLHGERSFLDQQRLDLEGERRNLATQRQREPIIAESIKAVALFLVAALPLVVCWYLVKSLIFTVSDDAAAAAILIEQLANQGPLLTDCSENRLRNPGEDNPPTRAFLAADPRLPSELSPPDMPSRRGDLQIVVVVEGVHDVQFLKRISRILSQADSSLPDLSQWESSGILVFVVNHGTSKTFPTGLSSSGPAEFHLLDRETPDVAIQRQANALAINSRPNSRAFLTSKRTIENYLHRDAICEVCGFALNFGDFDDVPELVARSRFDQREGQTWERLSRRARRRLRDKAKRWLNREAVDRMTPERLAERDPDGEAISWLRSIAEMAGVAAVAHF